MLEGIRSNPIIAGAYTDRQGGVCPMHAAHRHGGRTSYISVAQAWDRYTGAKRARPATEREINALTAMLEASIAVDELPSLSDAAREAQKLRERRGLRRFDEYERTVAELAVIRALNRPDERTEAQEPRSFVTS